jgi:signal transduction histidine kinase
MANAIRTMNREIAGEKPPAVQMPRVGRAWRRAPPVQWVAGWLERDALARLGVWGLLALISIAVAAQLRIPVVVLDPAVALAVAAASTVGGLALLQLEVLRFRALGRSLDVLVGVGFGTSAVANLLISAVAPAAGLGASHLQTLTALALASRALACVVFGLAVLHAKRVISPVQRGRMAIVILASTLLALVVGSTIVVWSGSHLPSVQLSPAPATSLEAGEALSRLLNGHAGWLPVGNAVLTVALGIATYGFLVLAKRETDRYLGSLALGLSLLALSQVHAVLSPPGVPGYVSSSDVYALLAYLSLLVRLLSQVPGDVAERASADERLRMSRDLHDGLAQQLSVLNLRLSQAIQATPAPGGAMLTRCHRLAQAALLEARQAITALRAGRIAWEAFVENLEAFCNESSLNQGVGVGLRTEGTLPGVDAELQVEVLRMLNETISNAVRHGRATWIDVRVVVAMRPARLALTVQDDGRGFVLDGSRRGAGVGLSSLAERLERRGGLLKVASRPARGTLVQVDLPLQLRNGRAV